MFKYIKNESGQSMVLVALMIFVLLGFGALAVDVGAMTYQRSSLQNAADAAALAGAMSINEADVKNKIKILAHDNINKTRASNIAQAEANLALLNAEVTSDINKSDNTVIVNIKQDVPKFLSGIFSNGTSEMHVKAKAKIKLGTPFDDFNYAVFSGNKEDKLELKFTGNNNNIKGNVHSNNQITGTANVTGNVTARKNIGSSINAISPGQTFPDSPEVAMPTIDIEEIKSKAKIINGTDYSPDELGGLLEEHNVIFVNGDVTVNGTGVNAKGTIISTGKITFNGMGVTMDTSTQLCLYSLNGDIIFNGTGSTINGILFAPNGSIEFSGGDGLIHGRVIADKIKIAGGKMNVVSGTDELSSLPASEKILKLVE